MMSMEAAARALLKACRAHAVQSATNEEVIEYLGTAHHTETAALAMAVARLAQVAKYDASLNSMFSTALYLSYQSALHRDGLDKPAAVRVVAEMVRREIVIILGDDDTYVGHELRRCLDAIYKELDL